MTLGRCLAAILLAASLTAPKVPQGWLGFGFLPHRGAGGTIDFLHVRNVARGGPAERAGLHPLDVIVALNGKPVRFGSEQAVLTFFSRIAAGQHVLLIVLRGGKPWSIDTIAARAPSDQTTNWNRNRALAARPKQPS